MTAPETSPSPNPNIITPTIGRRLWFWPAPVSLDRSACTPRFTVFDPNQPLDAGVVYCHSNRMVNLLVTDHAGLAQAVTSVRLLQADDTPNPGEAYAQWMPYQAAQNAKAAAPAPGPAPSLPGDSYVYPTRREEAMHALVSGAAISIANGGGDAAARIADNILAVVNKLHPLAEHPVATVAYPDGTTATGVAPLPTESPAQPVISTVGARWAPGEAPRVLGTQVEEAIVDETYTVLPSGRVTVCELTLQNGFTVWGSSAVVFSENNVPEKGRKIAREKAVDQVWQLLGYALREQHA